MATETTRVCDFCGATIDGAFYFFVSHAYNDGADHVAPMSTVLALQEPSREYCSRQCLLAEQADRFDDESDG